MLLLYERSVEAYRNELNQLKESSSYSRRQFDAEDLSKLREELQYKNDENSNLVSRLNQLKSNHSVRDEVKKA